MNVRVISLALFGSILVLTGCSGFQNPDMMPVEPKGSGVKDLEQFNQILSNVDSRKGQKIQLAGRLQRVEEIQDGYKVFASWLPYPSSGSIEEGPRDNQQRPVPNFLFYFHGKIGEKVFSIIQGNTFILEGTIQGTEKYMVNMFGAEKNLLTLAAGCVRIWETGTTSMEGTGVSVEYPGAIARTFCSKK